ncbi:hypothetical protein MO973_05695 [Paenibacillus sp. TRM 82003]|nr:hypothetical protein [Paenibacillus sp. TRM 82003]
MTTYWLIPLTRSEPVTLGSERVALSADEGETIRGRFASAHPRLLPSFKEALLIGGDDEACGVGEGADGILPLRGGEEIALTGALSLSHCGEAFVERLIAPEEALRIFEASASPTAATALAAEERVLMWWRQGCSVMLLKEE